MIPNPVPNTAVPVARPAIQRVVTPLATIRFWLSWLLLAGFVCMSPGANGGASAQTNTSAEIASFVGSYAGSAEMTMADGGLQQRDLSVTISETKKGFRVSWTTVTYKSGGRTKEKTYDIDFLPTDRDGVFAAAQKKNVFGHEVQRDPMKGEPYVWSRIVGDTLTVYSLFVDDDGGYEIQQFGRTLTEGGLDLVFNRFRNGEKLRAISAFLAKE